MKLIFLDIDGVLATDESSEQEGHPIFAYPFDRECVSILNEILDKTNAEIVLSSDWRLMYNNDLEMLDNLFKHNGIIKSPIDVTPNFSSRNKEIASYVHKHSENISSFIILDDMDLMIHSLRFIRLKMIEGLKEKGIKEKVIERLNSGQSTIRTCINCENEYYVAEDKYCCSSNCRMDIDKNAKGMGDAEIEEYVLKNRIVRY